MSSGFNFFADEVAYRALLIKGRKKTATGWRCAACHQAREYRNAIKGAA